MVIFIVWLLCIPLEQKANLNLIEQLCGNKDFCGVVSEFNQYRKCDKTISIIYTDLESLIKRVEGYENYCQSKNYPQ